MNIKKFLGSRLTLFLAIPIVISIIIYGCQKANDKVSQPSVKYDGKELFYGLVLRQGPVADLVPLVKEGKIDVSNESAEIKAKSQRFNNDIIDQIQKTNPSFFSTFQEQIQSGDQVQIRAAINAAAAALFSAINAFPEYAESLNEGRKLISQIDLSKVTNAHGIIDKQKLAQEFNKIPDSKKVTSSDVITEHCCSAAIVCAAAYFVWVFAAVDAVVATNVAGAVGGYVYLALEFWGPALESPGSSEARAQTSLMGDMLINQIAQNLSTAK